MMQGLAVHKVPSHQLGHSTQGSCRYEDHWPLAARLLLAKELASALTRDVGHKPPACRPKAKMCVDPVTDSTMEQTSGTVVATGHYCPRVLRTRKRDGSCDNNMRTVRSRRSLSTEGRSYGRGVAARPASRSTLCDVEACTAASAAVEGVVPWLPVEIGSPFSVIVRSVRKRPS